MKKDSKLNILAFALLSFSIIPNAQAYLDPGAAGYIFQVLIALSVGGWFFFKSGSSKIIGKVKRIFVKKK